MSPSLEEQIKQKLVAALELKIAPDKIGDETPLFRDGLGLDSVDALEVAAMLATEFDVDITDRDTARAVLASVKTIADHIRSTKGA